MQNRLKTEEGVFVWTSGYIKYKMNGRQKYTTIWNGQNQFNHQINRQLVSLIMDYNLFDDDRICEIHKILAKEGNINPVYPNSNINLIFASGN